MIEFMRNHKRAGFIVCILIAVFVLSLSRFGRGQFVAAYYHLNYGNSEYYIGNRLYYDSEKDSDLSTALGWKGIQFPSIVFRIHSYDNIEKSFCVGMHGFSIWDTYQIDIVKREAAVARLERLARLYVNEIMQNETMVNYTTVWLSPFTAEDGYDPEEIYGFDMEFSGDIPFKSRSVLFETEFKQEGEDVVMENAMNWLLLLNKNNLRFDYISIMYDDNGRTAYRRYSADYENQKLTKIDQF